MIAIFRRIVRPQSFCGAFDIIKPAILGAAFAGALLACGAAPAVAASAVTFVSGKGVNTGACTRATPCRNFQFALSQTSAGGLVVALDPAGYGPVYITQSVTLAGPAKGVASISPKSTVNYAGVDIEAPGATVVLRGLEIDGGYNGVNIGQAASVVISDSVIVGSSNVAINAADTGASVLVQDTTVRNAAIASYAASFVAKRVAVSGATGAGIAARAGNLVLDDCTVSGSSGSNVTLFSSAIIKHGVITSGVRGISSNAGSTYIDSTTTFGNQVGLVVVGTTFSYGNNNFPDGTNGTITPIAGD